jgi:hypothetical protein
MAFHAWNDPRPEPKAESRQDCEDVALLIAAGAAVDSASPTDPHCGSLLVEKCVPTPASLRL